MIRVWRLPGAGVMAVRRLARPEPEVPCQYRAALRAMATDITGLLDRIYPLDGVQGFGDPRLVKRHATQFWLEERLHVITSSAEIISIEDPRGPERVARDVASGVESAGSSSALHSPVTEACEEVVRLLAGWQRWWRTEARAEAARERARLRMQPGKPAA